MPTSFPAVLLALGAATLLSGCSSPDKAPATSTAPPAPEPVAEWEPILEQPYGASGRAAVLAEVQRTLVLPLGTPVPAPDSRVVVRFEMGGGGVNKEWITQSLNPVADSAVLAAVHLLHFTNGPAYYRPSVTYTLVVPAPGADSEAQSREATTRWQRTAVRWPGEADTTFVRRVLPCSYDHGNADLLAYAWRPSAFGKQLFFSRRGGAGTDNEDGTDLYVLDPYQPATYAVQVLPLDNSGSLPNYLAAVFFADATADGHLELLALVNNYVYERDKESGAGGHATHYYTDIWQYDRPGPDGRPHYRHDTAPRPYLDELPTAAAVRRALARHHQPPK